MRMTDRSRINATEMDAFRRSARISKLDTKTNEYIREKTDAPDTILDKITRKQLIWYGHVERMDPTRLPKILINWQPEGRIVLHPYLAIFLLSHAAWPTHLIGPRQRILCTNALSCTPASDTPAMGSLLGMCP